MFSTIKAEKLEQLLAARTSSMSARLKLEQEKARSAPDWGVVIVSSALALVAGFLGAKAL